MESLFINQQKEIEEYLSLCYKEQVPFSVLYKDYSKEDRSLEKETLTFFLEQKLIGIDRVPLIALIYSAEKEIEISIDSLEQVQTNPSDYSLFIDTITIEKRQYINYLEKLFDIAEKQNTSEYQRVVQVAGEMKRWENTFKTRQEELKNQWKNMYYVIKDIQKLLHSNIEAKPWETIFCKLPKAMGTMEYSELIWFLKEIK